MIQEIRGHEIKEEISKTKIEEEMAKGGKKRKEKSTKGKKIKHNRQKQWGKKRKKWKNKWKKDKL